MTRLGNRDKLCPPSRVNRYKGLRAPRCNAGDGCSRCWVKYDATKKRGLRVVAP